MAALSAARNDVLRKQGDEVAYPVLAGQKIYEGSTVLIEASSGYAITNDGTTKTISAGDMFVGICAETADNTSGSNGDVEVRVYAKGTFELPFASGDSIAQANVGDTVLNNNTSDDGEVTITDDAGIDVAVGKLIGIAGTDKGRVAITPYTIAA